jgi:hypothetical protein
MTEPPSVHAGCDRALARANDQLEALRQDHRTLKQKHALLVATCEGLRVYQSELGAMRLRGEPVQRGFALAIEAVIKALEA